MRTGARSAARSKAARTSSGSRWANDELVVLAPAERLVERRAVGDRHLVERDPDARRRGEAAQVAGEAVGDVDHRRRPARRGGRALREARRGPAVARRRARSSSARAVAAASQPRGRAAERAGDEQRVARAARPLRATGPARLLAPSAATTTVVVAERRQVAAERPRSRRSRRPRRRRARPRRRRRRPARRSTTTTAERARAHRGEVAQRRRPPCGSRGRRSGTPRCRGARPRRRRRCTRARRPSGRSSDGRVVAPRERRRGPPSDAPQQRRDTLERDILTPDPTPTGGGGWVRREHGTCLP